MMITRPDTSKYHGAWSACSLTLRLELTDLVLIHYGLVIRKDGDHRAYYGLVIR